MGYTTFSNIMAGGTRNGLHSLSKKNYDLIYKGRPMISRWIWKMNPQKKQILEWQFRDATLHCETQGLQSHGSIGHHIKKYTSNTSVSVEKVQLIFQH